MKPKTTWSDTEDVALAYQAGLSGTCWTIGPEELAHILNMVALTAAPAPVVQPKEWSDAHLRGIASDYFPDAKDWPAAMLCLRHLLMEQARAALAQQPAREVDESLGFSASAFEAARDLANVDKNDFVRGAQWAMHNAAKFTPKHSAREVMPLTDEQMLKLVLLIAHGAPETYQALCYESGPYSVTKLRSSAIALIRTVERAHGIGTKGGV